MRTVWSALAGLALLAAAACGGGGDDAAATDSGGEDAAAAGGETAAEGADVSAALLLVQARGDQGVVDALVEGYLAGAEEFGYEDAQILELEDPATYVSALRQVAEGGATLIIATFPPMTEAVTTVAPEFPDTKFALIDAELPEPLPNVQELFFFENEASYLAGVAAGLMTESDRVGFIGGVDADVINRYLVGFYGGVKDTNEAAVVCWAYTNDLQDPAKGKEVALSLIDDGIDVLHAATAGTQLGIYEAVEEQEGTFLVSADVDVRPLAPTAGLFATGPFFDEATRALMEEHANGEFTDGFIQYGIETGLVGRTEFSDAVPPDVADAVDEAEEAIRTGEIEVVDLDALPEMDNCS